MINLLAEHVLTMREAGRYVGRLLGTKSYHQATLYKWTTQGVSGVRLEFGCVGSARVTSKEAIQRFSERVAAVRGGGVEGLDVEPIRLPRVRGRDAERRRKRIMESLRSQGVVD